MIERLAGLELLYLNRDVLTRACGCRVVVGIRLDTKEPAMVGEGCEEHLEEMELALEAYKKTLEVPAPDPRYDGRDVVNIMDELLREEGI